MRLCKKDNCHNPAASQRTICYTCKSRVWAKKNPVIYAWHMLKKSAKKRGYSFTITKEWFREFVKGNGYIESKGRLFSSLTVDRIDNDRGYDPDNLQVIPKTDNIRKYHYHDKKEHLPF